MIVAVGTALLVLACSGEKRKEELKPPKPSSTNPSPPSSAYRVPVIPQPRYRDRGLGPRPVEPMRTPDVLPLLVESAPPEYTPEALKQRIGGIVILQIVVERDGRVSSGRVIKGLEGGLTQKAIDAVEKYRYEPALYRGKPVQAIINVTMHFRLWEQR